MGREHACCEDFRQTLAGNCPAHRPLLKVVAPSAKLNVRCASDRMYMYALTMNSLLHSADILDHGFLEQSGSSGVDITNDKGQPCVKEETVLQLQDKNNNTVSAASCEPWKCSNCNKMFGTFLLLEQHSCQSKRTKQGSKSQFDKFLKRPNASPAKHGVNACHVINNDKNDVHVVDVKESIPGSSKLHIVKESVTFACHLCSKVFLNPDKLKTHGYMHTGERPYPCTNNECTKAFISKYKLLRHMTTHSPMKVHLCSYCDKKFHRKDHLKNHLQTHDPNKIAYRCAECGKMYNTKPGYKKHVALHAAASGELNCKICDKDFSNTESLLEHIKLHSGKSNGTKEKKHRCEHCGRQFYTRKDVRRHMVVHTGRKDFLCQTCGQRFGRKDHLVRHARKSHDSSNQLRVKLGQHLHAVGSETVQQMLEKQQLHAQHLRLSAKPATSPSNKFTDLLKIPSVALPRLLRKEAVKIHAPAGSTVQAVLLDNVESAAESGSVDVKGICVPGNSLYAGSVELGEFWSFVSLPHQSPITTQPSTAVSPVEPSSSPGAVRQQHQPEFQQANHQQQAQQLQLQQQQQQTQAMHYLPTTDLGTSSSHATCNSFHTNVVQAPFSGLQSSLPGFHQAFQ